MKRCGQRVFQKIQLWSCPCGRISESCPWHPQSATILCHRRWRRGNRRGCCPWWYLELYRHSLERHTGGKGAAGIWKAELPGADLAWKAFSDLHDLRACRLMERTPHLWRTGSHVFEGSTASGAERAYRRAVDKLTELLVAEGAIHAIRLKQKSKTKCKKKNRCNFHTTRGWKIQRFYQRMYLPEYTFFVLSRRTKNT